MLGVKFIHIGKHGLPEDPFEIRHLGKGRSISRIDICISLRQVWCSPSALRGFSSWLEDLSVQYVH